MKNLRDVVLALHALAVVDQSEILGHLSGADSIKTCLFKSVGKVNQVVVLVELATEGKTTSPGVDGCH